MMVRLQADVIVVGAGPVGVFAANLLARDGLKVIIFEKGHGMYWAPRAVSIAEDSIRMMRSFSTPEMYKWILDNIIVTSATLLTKMALHPDRKLLLHVRSAAMDLASKIKVLCMPGMHCTFYQPDFEQKQREVLLREETAQLMEGCTVTDIHQGSDGICVVHIDRTQEDGRIERVVCTSKYVLGADGGNSTTRKLIGAAFEGETHYNQPWIVVDTKVADREWFEKNRFDEKTLKGLVTGFVCDSTRPAVVVELPGEHWRFEMLLNPGEDRDEMLKEETIQRLLTEYCLVKKGAVTVERAVVYNFHSRVASHWAHGNVFILGDAAHCQPPFSGQGMNSGLRDAANLCWKISFVHRGLALPALLATYEEERVQQQWGAIKHSIKLGRFVMLRNVLLVWLRNMMMYLLIPLLGDLILAKDMLQDKAPYVLDGFTKGNTHRKVCAAGKYCVCPWLRLIGSSEQSDSRVGQSFWIDEFLSPSGFTLLWITRRPDNLQAAVSFSKEQEVWLKKTGSRIVHIRLYADRSEEPGAGADITLKEEKNDYFSKWCDSGFPLDSKLEVIVVRPDKYIFGVYKHKQGNTIVAELKERLG